MESFVAIFLTVKTIVGNCLVLLAVYRTPQLRKVYNAYVVCLAFSDLCMGVLVFPIIDAALVTGKFPGGKSLCWFQVICIACFNLVSIYTLVLISVQRFYRVVKPNKHNNLFSRKRVALSVGFIWLVAAVLSLLLCLAAHGVQFYEQFSSCYMNADNLALFVGILPFCLVLPFAMMIYFYANIWNVIRNHNSHMGHSNVNAEEVKLTKLLCCVLGAFAVSFIPYGVTMTFLYLRIELPRAATTFSLIMAMFSSAVNPFIYGVMNREFRKAFAEIVCFPRKSSVSADIELAL